MKWFQRILLTLILLLMLAIAFVAGVDYADALGSGCMMTDTREVRSGQIVEPPPDGFWCVVSGPWS